MMHKVGEGVSMKMKKRKECNNTNEVKIKKIDYGNGMYEITKSSYSSDARHNPNRYKKLDKDTFVDTELGLVIEVKHAETKFDSLKSVRKSMNSRRRRLLYNINHILKKGYCVFETFTFSYEINDFGLLNKIITAFIKALKYVYKTLKYCCFTELSYENYLRSNNLYHLHCVFWFDEEMNERERYEFKNFTYTKWDHGSVKDYKEIISSKDLNNILFYLCNYSGDSTKSKQKSETLKHFPPNYRTVKETKGLENPTKKELDSFTETIDPFSYSSPRASCGHLSLATYIEQDNSDSPNKEE